MFKDRKDAALQLARALEAYRNTDALVLGIPRGGAETGFYIAQHLHLEFSLLVCRKLGHPNNPEYAIGAMAEDGTLYLNQEAREDVPEQAIMELAGREAAEIKRRIEVLRQGQPLPQLKDRTVILADDGIATGATLYAAIRMCRNKKAGKIVVAAPVAGRETKRQLLGEVEEVVILQTPALFHAVSQAYDRFYNLSDAEARGFMEQYQQQRPAFGLNHN